MAEIEMLQALHGDAFILHCHKNGNNGVIVVDGGPYRDSRKIVSHLDALNTIDLMVLTHYDDDHIGNIDIVKNQDGELELVGYNTDAPLPLKGQHQTHSHKVFRKSDGQINKTFQNAEERLYDLGKKVRELF